MPVLETYKKQAKQLLRWHHDGNHSVGGRIRQLPRYRDVADHDVLALNFKLTEAQEVIALEAGFDSWSALRAAVEDASPQPAEAPEPVRLEAARPVLFVRDVQAAAGFYRDRLGFGVDFLHGHPAFYGSVSRDGATLHLRLVHEPVLTAGAAREEAVVMAFIEVRNVKELYAEYLAAGVEPAQKLTKQAWGGTDFIVRDPDGNTVAFVG
ncbi:VOC family protein [Kribbella sp. NPDC000426]|uniref:bleomycin resistance protein n=1 Tax=Kribbella sp. NPDC000426 TaxID=3154255 RepID=UPI0033215E23